MKKNQFLADFIEQNPDTTCKEAVAAWSEAGGLGTISETTFYKIKREVLGNGVARRPRRGRSKGARKAIPANGRRKSNKIATQATVNGPGVTQAADMDLDRMEAALDEVIFALSNREGTEAIRETLRDARRQIIRLS